MRINDVNDMRRMLLVRCVALCCILTVQSPLYATGLEGEGADGDSTRVHHTFRDRLRQVRHYLDSAACAKVDARYIEVPAKPWKIVLRYKENAFGMTYDNSIEEGVSPRERVDWQLQFQPPATPSIGVWVGYRGLGIAFSKALRKKSSTYFSLGCTSARYGLMLRLRGVETSETTVNGVYYEDGEMKEEWNTAWHTDAPVRITSMSVNGYYVFSGRRYSQAAAYNQSVIQRRSAGSLLVGGTWYMSSFDYSDDKNSGFILMSNNTGRMKLLQASAGVGYGFNWVPVRGLVVNAMAMPGISLLSRVKVYKYDCNYTLSGTDEELADDYGQWDEETHTWSNGKTHRPFPADDEERRWLDDIDAWQIGSETSYSALRFNADLRLGIAYNWRNYFIGLQAQFNYFSYKKDKSHVRLLEGNAQASIGIRL